MKGPQIFCGGYVQNVRKSRRSPVTLLCSFALCLSVVGLSTPPLQAQTPISGQPIPELSTLDTTMTQIMSQWNVPGAALAVTYNGRLVFAHGYGYANSAALEQV